MDIAGSAVGIISFGLQVCNGVITYYNAYKGQDADLDDVLRNLETLKGILTSLREALPRLSSLPNVTTSIAQVEACTSACNASLVKLEEHLVECREVTPTSEPLSSLRHLGNTLKNHGRKALLPFRMASLDSLREKVNDVRHNLDMAINVLQLSAFDQISVLMNTTTAQNTKQAEIHDTVTRVESGVHTTAANISRIAAGITLNTSTLESTLPRLQDGISKISHEIPRLEAQNLLMIQMMETLLLAPQVCLRAKAESSAATRLNRYGQIIDGSPGPWKTICDDPQKLPLTPITSASSAMPFCSCRAIVDSRRIMTSYGPFILYRDYSKKSFHFKECPISTLPQTRDIVGLRIRFTSAFLTGIFSTSISATKGAGKYSIAPGINFRTTVPRDSPAFALIGGIGGECWKLDDVSAYFDGIYLQLRKMLEGKYASLSDIDQDGNTLLHTACSVLSGRYTLRRDIQSFSLQIYSQFLLNLAAMMTDSGVDINEPNVLGLYPLDGLVGTLLNSFTQTNCKQEVTAITAALINSGSNLSSACLGDIEMVCYDRLCSRPILHTAQYFTSSILADAIPEFLQCGLLSKAVMNRSVSCMKKVISCLPGYAVVERTVWGQTPLHFAAGWPRGLKLLLDTFPHMIDIPDIRGYLPISYAVSFQCEESVAILLDRDSLLGSETFPRGVVDALDVALENPSVAIRQLLITAYSKRRQSLQALAIQNLQREITINLSQDRVLDANSGKVYIALVGQNVHVPKHLVPRTSEHTVYHLMENVYANAIETADMFYAAGFRALDSPDEHGCIPLMFRRPPWSIKNYVEYKTWLAAKQPEWHISTVNTSPNISGVTAAHFVALGMGHLLQEYVARTHCFNESDARNLGHILDTEFYGYNLLGSVCTQLYYHDCQCACSCNKHSCIPIVVLLRRLQLSRRTTNLIVASNDFKILCLLEFTISWLTSRLQLKGDSNSSIAISMMRLLTFEKLQIAHTCCRLNYGHRIPVVQSFRKRDPEEIHELQDEHGEGIALLDRLMHEFIPLYLESDSRLDKFLKGYWKDRMDEVLKSQQVSDDEELQMIRELGVVLDFDCQSRAAVEDKGGDLGKGEGHALSW